MNHNNELMTSSRTPSGEEKNRYVHGGNRAWSTIRQNMIWVTERDMGPKMGKIWMKGWLKKKGSVAVERKTVNPNLKQERIGKKEVDMMGR